jgi:GAF domain-containing protein
MRIITFITACLLVASLSLAAVEKPVVFIATKTDPAVGDWKGDGGMVAQVIATAGSGAGGFTVIGSTVYFVAESGVGFHTLPRDISFCAYAIHTPKLLVVPDAIIDPRFADNPIVQGDPHVRFYAGAPLIDRNGYCLGTFCIVDVKPRVLTNDEESELAIFSERAMRRIDLLAAIAEMLSGPEIALLV